MSVHVLNAVADIGISINQARTLCYLTAGAMTPMAISKSLGISTAAITGLIDALVAKGFVDRDWHKVNARSYLVCLTDAGLEAATRIVHA